MTQQSEHQHQHHNLISPHLYHIFNPILILSYPKNPSKRNAKMSTTAYLSTITNTSSFTPEVQNAASALAPAKDTLQAAIEAALAMGETETAVSGEQADLLKKGFEYATQVVKMLVSEPQPEEKLDVRFS